MKKILLALVLIAGLVLAGCAMQRTFVCPNGAEVVNKDDCTKFNATPTPTPTPLPTATPTATPTPTPPCFESCVVKDGGFITIKCSESCPAEMKGICSINKKYSTGVSVRNDVNADNAWWAYIQHLKDNALFGYNYSVAWMNSNAIHYGIYQNHSWWKVSFLYYTIEGKNGTGAEYVNEKGDVADLFKCRT